LRDAARYWMKKTQICSTPPVSGTHGESNHAVVSPNQNDGAIRSKKLADMLSHFD